MPKQLPEHMMEMLRGRRGLEETDTSQDKEILKMTPQRIVRECSAWKLGDPYCADFIMDWMMQAGCKVPKKES